MNELIPLYKEMAAGGAQFLGLSVLQHKAQIGKLIKQHKVETLLDFGCGRGDAYKSPYKVWYEWRLKRPNVHLYDPAFPQHDNMPARKFDMVICSDVLEHVPEADIDAFAVKLFDCTKSILWASVCTRAAKKCFPDGTNLHVTQRPYQWWHDTLSEINNGTPFVLVETP